MKKLVLFVALLLCTATVFAQTKTAVALSPYSWKQHGISFKVPGGANILQSSGDAFEVDNETFNIRMNVYDGSTSTDDELAALLVNTAIENGMLNVDKAEIQEFKNNGVTGVSMEGFRTDDRCCTAVVISDKSHLLVLINVVYANGYEVDANNIINSITMNQ